MFFCRHPVFVEGLEDVAFITAALHLYGYWDRFHSLGCHLVPANGKNHLIHPVAIARCMEIPFFLVFDCDGDAKESDLPKHEPDNKTLFSLVDMDVEEAFPEDRQLNNCCAAWPKIWERWSMQILILRRSCNIMKPRDENAVRRSL